MQEHKPEEELHTKGQKACDLPEDFTSRGNLLDADADIKGLPAPRAPKFKVVIAPAGSCDPVDFTQPSAIAQQHREPEGTACLCSARFLLTFAEPGGSVWLWPMVYILHTGSGSTKAFFPAC